MRGAYRGGVRMKAKKALLVIDVQNDFCPGGALAVPAGEKVVPVLNKYARIFSRRKHPVFATRDWHPVRTVHFKDFGGKWPAHCIQNTQGAAFHPGLKLPAGTILLYKGMDSQKDSYSAFQSEDERGVSFLKLLEAHGITELYVGGLATDYCVRSSVLEALKRGFKVRVLVDAIRGVDLKPGDSERALKEMKAKGAKTVTLKRMEAK